MPANQNPPEGAYERDRALGPSTGGKAIRKTVRSSHDIDSRLSSLIDEVFSDAASTTTLADEDIGVKGVGGQDPRTNPRLPLLG